MADLKTALTAVENVFPALKKLRTGEYVREAASITWNDLKDKALGKRSLITGEREKQVMTVDAYGQWIPAATGYNKWFNTLSTREQRIILGLSHGDPNPGTSNEETGERYVTTREVQKAIGLSRKPTLAEFAEYVYGDAAYAELLKQSNQYSVSAEGVLLSGGLLCPLKPLVPPIAEASKYKPHIMPEPLWVGQERAITESYTDGLAVIIFERGSHQDHFRVRGMPSISCRASIFEASRGVELTWPSELNGNPFLNLYGNHVGVAYNGELIFMGVLVEPSIMTNKGRTTSWIAKSHTFRAMMTHFNPQSVRSEYYGMAPLDVLMAVSEEANLHIKIEKETLEQLKAIDATTDDKGYKKSNDQDILGTTPLKTIQRIIDPFRYYATATETGMLEILKVDINSPPVYTFIEGDPERGLFDLDVKYKFEELARTYYILSQRRTKAVAVSIYKEFPIPIFKNLVRQGVQLRDGEVAEQELSKSLADSLNIDMVVPGWLRPSSTELWKTGDVVRVLSPTYGLAMNYLEESATISGDTKHVSYVRQYPMILIVTGVTFEQSKDWKHTKLSLTLPGVFDVRYPHVIPFLTAPGQSFSVETEEIDVEIQNAANLGEGDDEQDGYNEEYGDEEE